MLATAQVTVGEALSGLNKPEAAPPVDRIERDTARSRARADAIEELLSAGFFGPRGDAIAALGTPADGEDDGRLASLKREVEEGNDA